MKTLLECRSLLEELEKSVSNRCDPLDAKKLDFLSSVSPTLEEIELFTTTHLEFSKDKISMWESLIDDIIWFDGGADETKALKSRIISFTKYFRKQNTSEWFEELNTYIDGKQKDKYADYHL